MSEGTAAPEIHDHPHRVNHPLRRTTPKTAPDPGWERFSWDEALDLVASRLSAIRSETGPEAVLFSQGTSGGTGMLPSSAWINRLARSFGTPNQMDNLHMCNWARDGAAYYTFGAYPLPPPEVEHSHCILVWGANPRRRSSTSLRPSRPLARGARLIVVDPRRIGLAAKADLLLQVRPGTDGALALVFVHLLIAEGWFDDEFVREWTNAPLLVRTDVDRLLRGRDRRAAGQRGGRLRGVASCPRAAGPLHAAPWLRRPDRRAGPPRRSTSSSPTAVGSPAARCSTCSPSWRPGSRPQWRLRSPVSRHR